MLILDEATSSIDTRTEKLVQDGMDGLMYGRTTFVIAHRLSTVRNSDCIMVLEQGRIIERGTHDELIARRAAITACTPATLRELLSAEMSKKAAKRHKINQNCRDSICRPGGFCAKCRNSAKKVDGKVKSGYNRIRRHAKSSV